jgi:hypothetical protein
MLIPRAKALAATALLLAVGACAYDWTVGVAPSSEGDAGLDASSSADAPGERDSTTSDVAVTDAGLADAPPPSCAALLSAIASARGPGKRCTQGVVGACAAKIKDECGCDSYLGENDASANAFVGAVTAYFEADCGPPSSCPTCVSPSGGTCLITDGGPPACFP